MRLTALGGYFLYLFISIIVYKICYYINYDEALAIYFGFISSYLFVDLFLIRIIKILTDEITVCKILMLGLTLFIFTLNLNNNIIINIYLNTTSESKIIFFLPNLNIVAKSKFLFVLFSAIGFIAPLLEYIIIAYQRYQNRIILQQLEIYNV